MTEQLLTRILKFNVNSNLQSYSFLGSRFHSFLDWEFPPEKLQQPKRKRPKNHICDKCGASFDRPNKLQIHNRIHTGDKPYSCEICGKCFNQKQNLKSHMVTHLLPVGKNVNNL